MVAQFWHNFGTKITARRSQLLQAWRIYIKPGSDVRKRRSQTHLF